MPTARKAGEPRPQCTAEAVACDRCAYWRPLAILGAWIPETFAPARSAMGASLSSPASPTTTGLRLPWSARNAEPRAARRWRRPARPCRVPVERAVWGGPMNWMRRAAVSLCSTASALPTILSARGVSAPATKIPVLDPPQNSAGRGGASFPDASGGPEHGVGTTPIRAAVLLAASIASGTTAQAELLGRDLDGNAATYEAYYDDQLNITWLADANHVKTQYTESGGVSLARCAPESNCSPKCASPASGHEILFLGLQCQISDMPIIIRALLQLLMNWGAVVALLVLILAGGFSIRLFLGQVGESVTKYWWIGALACILFLGREFIKGYFALKRKETGEKE